jgi:hypothetical protein
MEFKGTKGEWKQGNHISHIVSDVKPKRPTYSDKDYQSEKDFYGGYIVCESISNKEDSKLIAAAPDLLEALQELTHLHGCEQEGLSSGQPTASEWYEAVNKANEAIQKALS